MPTGKKPQKEDMGLIHHLPFSKRDMRLAFFLPLILLLGGAASGRVFAQAGNAEEKTATAGVSGGSYTEDPVDEKNQKRKFNDIGPMLRAGKFTNVQQQNDFDAYYKTYALSRWTQLSTLGDLNKYRQDLLNNLRQAKSGQVHDRLNELVLDYMNKLAKNDKYHPAVRYNAMLTIGDLNSVENMPPTPSVPLEAALQILLTTVNDPNQIDIVKIAALIGINRHLTIGVTNPQTQSLIFTTVLKLVTGADAADYSDIGRVWMRKQAVDSLGLLGNLGTNNQVVKLLSGYIGDAKAPFFLRLSSAEALGKLKYANASGLNPIDLAKILGQLMLDACGGELSGGNEAKLDTYDHLRRIKARLETVTEGLKGIKPLAKDPAQQTYLNDFQNILDTFFKELDKLDTKNKENLKKEDLQKSVEDCQAKLESWLAKKP